MTGKTATVLVVDDDDAVLELEALLLGSLGYDVIPARGAEDALQYLRAHAAIDLLLTDIVMLGGMDGWRLAKRAKEICPAMKVAYTSAYARDPAGEENELYREPVLPKPWHIEQFARFVDDVLTG